jgi:hypothetical protein
VAINLLAASDARIDFGDVTFLDGISELTVALTLRLNAAPADGRYLAQKWGAALADQQFLFTVPGTFTDEVGFAMRDSANLAYGKRTTDLNLASGNVYRIIAKLDPSANLGAIWVNGASRTLDVYLDNQTSFGTTANGATALQIGRNTDVGTDGEDGDYAEFALWTEYVPDWFCSAYGKGYAPNFYRRNLVFYAQLFNTSHLRDVARGTAGTNSSGTDAAHPSMLYPRGRAT